MDPGVKAALKAKFGNSAVRTGGKGTVRRKRPAAHKNTPQDDKKLQGTLKRLQVNTIPGIEEVNLFQADGSVIHFENPKVQASIAAHTFVVSGKAETKEMTELLPGILSQLGSDNLESLKQLLSAYQSEHAGHDHEGHDHAHGGDDDVPDLVENFEAEADEDELVVE